MTDDITKLLAEGSNDALAQISRSNTLGRVAELARQLKVQLDGLAELEGQVSVHKNVINRLKTVELPEAMAAMGAKSFTTEEGFTLEVREVVQASLPKDSRRELALEWLEEHDLGDVIKHAVNVTINKGDADTQAKVLEVLGAVKAPGMTVGVKDDVHPQTLNATIRSLLEKGAAVPLDLFNVFTGKTITIKSST